MLPGHSGAIREAMCPNWGFWITSPRWLDKPLDQGQHDNSVSEAEWWTNQSS